MAEDHQDNELSFFHDDTLKMKILATNNSLGVEKLDVEPVLSVAEDIIMSLANTPSSNNTNLGAQFLSHSEDVHVSVAKTAKVMEYPISYTSYVLTLKCAGGVDPNSLTMELLNLLSNYSWDAKVVITFAAFAINYGEFWLLHQLQDPRNQLADSISKLMRFPDAAALGHCQLQMEFKAALDVLTAGLKLTRCIVELNEILSTDSSSQQSQELFPIAVYWIMRGLVSCASTLTNLFPDFNEYITKTSAETRETLLSLASNLSAMLHPVRKQLKILKDKIEEERRYMVLQSSVESTEIDNLKVLTALVNYGEDQTPLYNGANRTKERLEVLSKKYVLLLISDLEFPPEELHILHLIYGNNSMRHEYEILWLPIINPTTSMNFLAEAQFYNIRNNIRWFSVEHPSFVHPVAIKYIIEDLHFAHMPIVVLLDPHGKLSHHDVLPMMWIWGAKAFPFTKEREKELWEGSEWNIDLLADDVDPRVQEWIKSNKVICLYGGNDVEWIRKFTMSAQTAARALNVPLEMLYVGNRNPKEKVRRCHKVITTENLSHIFAVEYYNYVWYFWVRLASIWHSKKQAGRTVDNDHIMQGALDILTYDSTQEGWAVFSRANNDLTIANGEKLLPILDNYTQWAYEFDHADKFVQVLDKHLKDHRPPLHATRLILPGKSGYIPERVVCAECGMPMDAHGQTQ